MRLWLILLAAVLVGSVSGVGVTLWEFFSTADDYGLLDRSREAGGGSVSSSAIARPRLVVGNGEEHDFGVMDVKAKGSHKFVFSNDGDAPLVLTAGPTSCRCTFVELEEATVAPGDSVDVELQWEAQGGTRTFSQTADILSNDPDRPAVRLKVRGWVTERFRASPSNINFGLVSAGQEGVAELELYSYYDDRFEVVSSEWGHPDTADLFDVSWEPLPADRIAQEPHARYGLRGRVTLKPGLPLGPIIQTIRLTTDLAQAPPVEVSFGGEVASDVSIFGPPSYYDEENRLLKLGVIKTTEEKSVRLFVLARGPHREQLDLEVGLITPDVLQVKIKPPKPMGDKAVGYQVMITVPQGSRPVSCLGSETGALGEIVLKTSHPTAPRIPIRVYFAVQ